jgi:hypothetical protein
MKTASHWASIAEFSEDKLSVSGDVITYTLDTEKCEYKVKGSVDGEVTFDFTFTIVDEAVTSKTYFSEERDNGYSGFGRDEALFVKLIHEPATLTFDPQSITS